MTQALTAPLPLTAAERKIAKPANQLLITTYAGIETGVNAFTKQPLRTAFWHGLQSVAARNIIACSPAVSNATSKPTKAAGKAGAKPKTRTAGS